MFSRLKIIMSKINTKIYFMHIFMSMLPPRSYYKKRCSIFSIQIYHQHVCHAHAVFLLKLNDYFP